jgi:integrase
MAIPRLRTGRMAQECGIVSSATRAVEMRRHSLFTRQRYQYGSLQMKSRSKGPDVWELRFYDESGNRKTVTVGDIEKYPTKTSAQKAIQGLLLKINSDSPSTALHVTTFGAVVDRFTQDEMPDHHSTRVSYKSLLKNYIKPKWGDVHLGHMKPMAVEHWLNNLTLASKTKSNIRSLMHSIWECALRWELIELQRNPMEIVRVKGGSKRKSRPGILSVTEFGTLLGFIPEPYKTMVVIAQCLGLRASEIMGLQWDDLDFKTMSVLIERGVVHGRVGDAKTEYSRDRVPIDSLLAEVLAQHRIKSGGEGSLWVFANPKTGKPYHQDSIQQTHLRDAGVKAELQFPVGWHTFRHTYRSLLDASGAPMTVQQQLMRHASIQTTMNVYGQAMPDSKRQANSKVVEMVLAAPKTEGPDVVSRALRSA